MGEGNDGKAQLKTEPSPAELERDVTLLRENVGAIVGELDHRRKALFDWRAHLERNKGLIVGVAGVALLLMGGIVAVTATVAQHKRRPLARVRNMNRGLKKLADDRPVGPSVFTKLLTAALSSLASVAVRTLTQRALNPSGSATARA